MHMNQLRTPFFILALVLMAIAIVVETGTALPGVLPNNAAAIDSFQLAGDPGLNTAVDQLNAQQPGALEQLRQQKRPPGLGIPDMALLDGILLFTVILVGVGLLLPAGVQARVQGIATLIFSLLLLTLALLQIFVAIGLLLLMISLLLSVPFGTIAYLIIYGSFNRGGADAVLSLLMLCKLGFCVSLFFAQQRFLQSKGLVLLIGTSLLCNVIVSFLLGLVPGFLVSITDAIAAIVVGIIAVIWAIFLLVGAIVSIVKVLRIERATPAVPIAQT